ncbi:unnamed protein product, partial [Brenthis ino]
MEKSFDFSKLLQNNEKKHKSKPEQFVSVAGGVKKRLANDIKKRKTLRLSVFDRIRNLPKPESPAPVKDVQSKVEYRRMQLEKWKEEKEKKKKEAALHKKKPFIAGVAHNALKFVPPPPPKPMPSNSGRVTRSQTARNSNNVCKQKVSKETKQLKNDPQSFAPKNAMFNPVLKNLDKPTLELPKLPNEKKNNAMEILHKYKNKAKPKSAPNKYELRNLRTRPDRKNIKSIKNVSPEKVSSASSSSVDSNTSEKSPIIKTPRKFIQNKKKITPKNIVPKSESSSEEKLRSPKSIEMPMTPQQIVEEAKKISPCVTLSRGKDNARKEMKKKLKEGLLDDDLCEMESVENFRRQLDSEIKRMTELCDTWEKISEQILLPEAVQEAVLGAIGQARLLMSQKLQQFASLLLRCECPEHGQALVTPGDLHGFWDMVFMQIVNVDMRFKKLEEMRARGWTEETPVEVKKKPTAKPPVNRNKPAATSRLRDMIAAARKAKKEQVTEQAGEPAISSSENKTFEAGFFCIQSPVKSPKTSTPTTKPSLLKAVLSSEAQKASASKSAASYAMLRASLLGKNVDSDTVYTDSLPLTPVNLGATPARSILKSNANSSKKSIKVVLFNASDQEIQDTLDKDDYKKLNTEDSHNDVNADCDLPFMDTEEKENISRRKLKLVHQNAFEDRAPIMTRSRRKSMQTPKGDLEEKRTRKKLQEVNGEEFVQTPRRSRRKSVPVEELT